MEFNEKLAISLNSLDSYYCTVLTLSAGTGLSDPVHTRVQFCRLFVQADSREGLEHSGPAVWRILDWEWSYCHPRKPVSVWKERLAVVQLACTIKMLFDFFSWIWIVLRSLYKTCVSYCEIQVGLFYFKMATDGGPSGPVYEMDQEYGDKESKSRPILFWFIFYVIVSYYLTFSHNHG